MTKEYVLKDTGKLGILNFKPNYSITFHCGNRQVGALDFNGPEMTFIGDMDESAKLFLELVATSFKTRLEQERAEEREACAKVCENQADDGIEGEWDGCCLTLAKQIRARGRE